jgi:tetratricopeptide (TPR) repeat protein
MDMDRDKHSRLTLLLCLGLLLGTFAVFGQVLRHEFINYDDPTYVTGNPNVYVGLTLEGVAWAFTSNYSSNWHPLTWISHMLDCQFFGLKPWGHHLSSLLLHAINTLLVFLVLKRMTGATWRSAVVAALFAWHPLHVESVAWVAERKDVLSATFWMLTLWAYLRYAQKPEPGRYLLCLLFFMLGLLSKPMVVTLPFVLLLLDYWPLGRSFGSGMAQQPVSGRRLLLEKLPFFLLATASSVVTFLAQKSGGAVASLETLTLSQRAANALISYARYLRKIVWPSDLAMVYPLPDFWPAPQIIGAMLFLLAVTTAVVVCRKSRPYLMVGWFWFLGTLVPVIGLVQVGFQSLADRYTYLPSIGIFILLVWGMADLAGRWPQRRLILGRMTALILTACFTLTWFQLRLWQNSVTLFSHALAVTTGNFVAHNNLGSALDKLGRSDEALVHFKAALEIRPRDPETLYNIGLLLARQDKVHSAEAYYQEALRDYAHGHYLVALAAAEAGKFETAIAWYREALRLKPDAQEALRNLAWILATNPKPELRNGVEAVRLAERACELTQHRDPASLATLDAAYAEAGRFDDAINSAQQVQELAAATHQPAWAEKAAQRLELYRAQKPYRE